MSESFGKEYKLCSKTQIDAIFVNKCAVKAYPFLLYYQETTLNSQVPFQIVLSAPKRSFKRAPDRNRIKRVMKEVLRKNKSDLETHLSKTDKQLALFLIYTSKDLPDYKQLDTKIVVLLNRLIEQTQ
ncbi:MAG: ribonuclease P protein component [Lishizhenia sp.]